MTLTPYTGADSARHPDQCANSARPVRLAHDRPPIGRYVLAMGRLVRCLRDQTYLPDSDLDVLLARQDSDENAKRLLMGLHAAGCLDDAACEDAMRGFGLGGA